MNILVGFVMAIIGYFPAMVIIGFSWCAFLMSIAGKRIANL